MAKARASSANGDVEVFNNRNLDDQKYQGVTVHTSPSDDVGCSRRLSRSAVEGEQAQDLRGQFQNLRSLTWPRGTPLNDEEKPVHAIGTPRIDIAQLVKIKRTMRCSRRSLIPKPSVSMSPIREAPVPDSTAGERQSLRHSEDGTIPNIKAQKRGGTLRYLADMIIGNYISLLLVFVPLAFVAHHHQWSATYVFWLNFLAMVPLASLLGDFTEILAAHTNQVIGGLLNATFGNAVEVVVAIQALLANEIRVVQASMIGSIFSNLLLVLGCCFFFGGIQNKEQAFNSTSVTANMSLLGLSSLAFALPTPFAAYYETDDEKVLAISRAAAMFLLFMYLQLLFFQLRTHAYLIEDDDEEDPELPFWVSLIGLILVTILIAVLSDYLVASIDEFTAQSGISRTFVGLIILPVVGNAVEHMTAVSVAMKNKMDLAMGVALGSSTQISLFVVPLIVIIGWCTDKSMTLNFPHFEIILYFLSIVIVNMCLSNGKGNWLLGSLLITTYVMVAVGFWYEKVQDDYR